MDKTDVKDDGGANGCCIMNKNDEKVEKAHVNVNGDDEKDSNSLLPPRRGGMSRKSDKTRRKVQWNDKNGNKLAEVLVYEPSDISDSEDEDSDSCICSIIMFDLCSEVGPTVQYPSGSLREPILGSCSSLMGFEMISKVDGGEFWYAAQYTRYFQQYDLDIDDSSTASLYVK
ncbi:hypothetical protein RIF29_37826 [Crotalaria pallida]|uniref:Uncharacterized protein n=1 Tax=Crotalaria pallida TaxID=3830 RepID=A0AAN9E0J1_CROPI